MKCTRLELVGLWLTVASGCSSRMPLEEQNGEFGSLYAAVELSQVSSGVTAIHVEVLPVSEPCGGAAVASQSMTLQDVVLPPSPETSGSHAFANGFFVLGVGEYRVCAVPLVNGTPSELCGLAQTTVQVQGQDTTLASLVTQCASQVQGGLDVVVSLNVAPTIERVTLTPSKYISECESLSAETTATDANGDELTYAWAVTAGPENATLLAAGATATFRGRAGQYSLQVTVSDGHGGSTHLTFPVEVAAEDCESDVTPPPPVTGLQAAVETRRETSFRLSWTPPNEPVAGYDVAYLPLGPGVTASVIDDANFDAAIAAPDVPGTAIGTVVHDLHIERDYLFAVRPYDAAGNLGPVVSTSSPLRAEFFTLVLDPPAHATPGTQWGYSVDASTDLDGDGTADLVIGQKYGDTVSVYLGHVNGSYSTTPSLVISGPLGSSFGSSVAVVGNIVGDFHDDLAIAAPTDGPVLGRVYIIDGQALLAGDVDVSDGTNPTGAVIDFPTTTPYPVQVVRLGDFDGDGDPDFGIHALGYGQQGACDPDTLENCEGAFLWIKGEANTLNFPETLSVPADSSQFEAYFPSSFGFYGADWLLGVTDLVGGRSGVLAAEYQAGVQRLITRDVGSPTGFAAQVLDYGPPQFSGDITTYDTEIGSYPAALVGTTGLALQLTNARNGLGATPGVVDIYNLSAANTFSSPVKTFKASGENNNFGQILIGNRYSGRPTSYSLPFFGRDAQAPALIMGGRTYAGKLPKLFMVGAARFAAVPQNPNGYELSGNADVEYSLSEVPGINEDWTDALGVPSAEADWHGGLGFAVRDMNGDGYADIGIVEWEFEAVYAGGVVLLY